MRATSSQPFLWAAVFIILLQLCQTNSQLLAGPRSWSSLFKRAYDLGRTAKWNEFIEEQKTESVRMDSQTNRTKSDQSLIDETKDPDSPYYISMISSNIGGGHQSGNRTIGNNKRDPNGGQQGLVSKLFNYAFSTGTPSRVMQTTTKQPLVTYINVSSLEEHDSEVCTDNLPVNILKLLLLTPITN